MISIEAALIMPGTRLDLSSERRVRGEAGTAHGFRPVGYYNIRAGSLGTRMDTQSESVMKLIPTLRCAKSRVGTITIFPTRAEIPVRRQTLLPTM